MFHKHLSLWIERYNNVDTLEWLRRFVKNSGQKQETKDMLYLEINEKIEQIKEASAEPC